jgi:hypothetical protein
MATTDLFLILNPVRTESAEDFETFVRDVLAPAAVAHRPDLRDKVRLWRSTEPEPGGGTVTIYAFEAQGISSWDDLELDSAFIERYGSDEAEHHLERFSNFFVDPQEWMRAWSDAWAAAVPSGDEGDRQYGWQMQKLDLFASGAAR